MSDPRRQAHNLRNYLLGGEDWGPGLVNRVLGAARAFSSDPGPVMSVGWVIGGRPAPEGDSISEDDVLELIVHLKHFLVPIPDFDASTEKHSEARWLAAHKKTDIDYLDGVMKRVRSRVDAMLKEPALDEAVNDALSLVIYLKAWLGTHCEHSFRPVWRERGVEVVRCDKCHFETPRANDQFPDARCEVCGGEMERLTEGRTRRTCSDACRQQKRRSA